LVVEVEAHQDKTDLARIKAQAVAQVLKMQVVPDLMATAKMAASFKAALDRFVATQAW
jgi:hypothetical protein